MITYLIIYSVVAGVLFTYDTILSFFYLMSKEESNRFYITAAIFAGLFLFLSASPGTGDPLADDYNY